MAAAAKAETDGRRTAADDEPEPAAFIGRENELLSLIEALSAAPSTGPRLILLRGIAGIGKSRLLEAAWAAVDRRPARNDWPAEDYDGQTTFGPPARWLRRQLGLQEGELASAAAERIARVGERTAGIDPADVACLQALIGIPQVIEQLRLLPPEHFRRNIERALGKFLLAQRNGAGLLLVVDHAQHLDAATGRWLDAALDGRFGAGLTVVVLTRDASRGWRPSMPPALDLELGPLSPDAAAFLFDAIAPAVEFLPELRQLLLQHRIGTPLFLGELSRLIRQVQAENAGPIRADQVARIFEVVPLSLERLIERRIELLDERDRLASAVVALLGADCSLGLMECFDQIRRDLADHLRALEAMRIIHRYDGEDGPHYRFIEGRVRDLAYDTLLPEQRRRLHAQAAEVIERAFADRIDSYFEALAFHTEKSQEPEKSLVWRVRAADRLRRIGEAVRAAEQYDLALETLDALDADDRHQTIACRILVRRARLARDLGAVDDSDEMLASALLLAEELGSAHLKLSARLERAIGQLWQGKQMLAREAMEKLRPEAEELGQEEAACIALNSLGVIAFHAGNHDAALGSFRRLGEVAQSLGIAHLEADALNNTGLIYWRWGKYSEAAQAFRASSSIRMRIGDKFGLTRSLLNLGIQQEQLGEVRPARRSYRQALEYSSELGYRQAEAAILINLTNLELRAGTVSVALEHASRALPLCRVLKDAQLEMAALENLGLARAAAHEEPEGEALLKEALNLAHEADAAEKAAQIELDLLEVSCREVEKAREMVARADELLKEVENHGWRDLLSQACRVKGRLLRISGMANRMTSGEYLKLARDFAVQTRNIFDERLAVRELLAEARQTGDSIDREELERQVERIDALLWSGPAG